MEPEDVKLVLKAFDKLHRTLREIVDALDGIKSAIEEREE